MGRRADVEREDIPRHVLAIGEPQAAGVAIEADRLAGQQADLPATAQGGEVDVAVVESVATGDEARDHAGVGRPHVAGDQRHPDAGQRCLAESLEHVDMGVAATDQHQLLHGFLPARWPFVQNCCISVL